MSATDQSAYRRWWLGDQAGDVDEFLTEEFRNSLEALRMILAFGAAFFLFRGLLEITLVPTPHWVGDLIFRVVGCAVFLGLWWVYTKMPGRTVRAIILCVYLASYISSTILWADTHAIHVGFLAVPLVLCMTIGIMLWPLLRGLYWPALSVVAPAVFMLVHTASPTRDWIAYGMSLLVTGIFSVLLRRARLRTSFTLFMCEKALRDQVDRDALTGLLNLSGWRERTAALCEQAIRTQSPLAIVYFDIDHFKAVNDQHGHAVGDKVLVHTAKTLATSLRPGDILARLGGEEFVLALPNTTVDQAEQVANRIRARLHDSASPVAVTISAGVAQMDKEVCLERAMIAADHGLLEAKRLGRNRVCRPPPAAPTTV